MFSYILYHSHLISITTIKVLILFYPLSRVTIIKIIPYTLHHSYSVTIMIIIEEQKMFHVNMYL